MTATEITALREQVTDIYKKAWCEWNRMAQLKNETERQKGDDCYAFDDAEYLCDKWDSAKDYLMHTIEKLLQLQCYMEVTQEEEGAQ